MPTTPTLTVTPEPSVASHLVISASAPVGPHNERSLLDYLSSAVVVTASVNTNKNETSRNEIISVSPSPPLAVSSVINTSFPASPPASTERHHSISSIAQTRVQTKSNRSHPNIQHHPTIHPHSKYSRQKTNSISHSGDSNQASQTTPTSPLSPHIHNHLSNTLYVDDDDDGRETIPKTTRNKEDEEEAKPPTSTSINTNRADEDDYDEDEDGVAGDDCDLNDMSIFNDDQNDSNVINYIYIGSVNLDACDEDKVSVIVDLPPSQGLKSKYLC